jgi:hypothetical protein
MSMTNHSPIGNQEPEPVRPWFARLFRRPAPVTAAPGPTPARTDPILRLTQDFTAALSETARWKQHADSYEQDRERAVKALASAYNDRVSAYSEVAHLLSWLAALHPASAVITPARDGADDGGRVLWLVAGGWQMSWPIAAADAHLFQHVTAVERTDPRAQWDGHGTEQKYERIRSHVRLLALDELGADGPSTGVTTEARSA